MKRETASLLRRIFLVLLIITDIAMLAFWMLAGQTVFFWVFIGINALVFIGEVVNSKWVYGRTLSTQVTKTVEAGGRKAVFASLAVIFLVVTMIFLAFHLLIHVKA